MRIPSTARGLAVLAVTPVLAALLTTTTAAAATPTPKSPVAVGSGGGVASVDADASRAGLDVLAAGGTAADAAVATAAALGVTEPYSAGIGGGGFFVYYDVKKGRVGTIDGRETAPKAMRADSFVDPATGQAYPFDRAVTSGLSVGIPGTPATWAKALQRWGHKSLADVLAPAAKIARDGFIVDPEFRGQTSLNEKRFRAFPDTAALFLPGGKLPEVGAVFRNPKLADTYDELGKEGVDWLYDGALAKEIAATAAHPPVDPAAGLPVAPGLMTTDDLGAYDVVERDPTHIGYRGLDLYGMAPPSSGGTTVGEALKILEKFDLSGADQVQALHYYLEASRLAYADRNRFLGDPAFVDVPTDRLLSEEFAAQRACKIDPKHAATSPVPAGDLDADADCAPAAPAGPAGHEGPSTTHLVAADKWGNIASYTLTIEQTGGSGITVPGRGFLLNNELTDFDYTPPAAGAPLPANAPDGGKRPRSSISPTIVLHDGKPLLAVGSPGGATIITTVLQTLVNRLDLGMSLPDAVAAPRISQRNAAKTEAEPAFLASPAKAALEAYGQVFTPAPSTFAPTSEIGAVAALEFGADGAVTYVAEPKRRGGGSAVALK